VDIPPKESLCFACRKAWSDRREKVFAEATAKFGEVSRGNLKQIQDYVKRRERELEKDDAIQADIEVSEAADKAQVSREGSL
jgi:hypothetical protein